MKGLRNFSWKKILCQRIINAKNRGRIFQQYTSLSKIIVDFSELIWSSFAPEKKFTAEFVIYLDWALNHCDLNRANNSWQKVARVMTFLDYIPLRCIFSLLNFDFTVKHYFSFRTFAFSFGKNDTYWNHEKTHSFCWVTIYKRTGLDGTHLKRIAFG